MGLPRALQSSRAKEGIDRIRACMLRSGPDSRERQMRETPGERDRKAPQYFALRGVKIAQLLGKQLLHLRGRDALEGIPQVREFAADGARCKLAAQPRKALVNSSPHGRQAHELRQ